MHVPTLLGATHAIINQGLWILPNETETFERRFATAMHSVAQLHPEITYVWKTTTTPRGNISGVPRDRRIVAEASKRSSSTWAGGSWPPPWRVLDVAGLAFALLHRVGLSLLMFDDLHYSSDVNSAMNQALLGEMLGSFSSHVFEC
eukprot:PhM_4_TR1315/c2_g6_i8/m.52893